MTSRRSDPDLVELLASAEPLIGMRRATAQDLAGHARSRQVEPGETLLDQGEVSSHLYLVVEGVLRAVRDDGHGHSQELGKLAPGALIGEISRLVRGRREAAVIADTSATVIEIAPPGVELLFDREPEVARRLAELAADRLRAGQLRRQLHALFPQLDQGTGDALLGEVEIMSLRPGQPLVQRGDPADAAYVVVSGRLRVFVAQDGGEALAELGPGELVGEMALVEDGMRTATVVALRVTHVARLRRESLLRVLRGHPETLLAIVNTAMQRVRGSRRVGAGRRTLALVAAHPTVDLASVADGLLAALRGIGPAELLAPQDVDGALASRGLAGGVPDEPRVTRIAVWLQEQEEHGDTLVLQTDPASAAWTEAVLRCCDRVVLVADAARDPAPTENERRVHSSLRAQTGSGDGAASLRTSLVLLHPADREPSHAPRGTARWLARREVDDCYHVRRGDARDVGRLARILAERPVALVLSGGGARGFAHLGVVRALEEEGVPVDMVGGSSIGAAMAAFVALGFDPGERVDRAKATLEATMDWTLPLVSLVKGARMTERAAQQVDGRDIEDLWLPWFAVSTNLTRFEVDVHRRGPLLKALRATTAIPGIIPPVVSDDALHVDGGVLDNLPIEHMRRRNPHGHVVAVDVAGDAGAPTPEDLGLSVSGWQLLARRVLPHREAARLPGIATMLMRSMVAGSSRERDRMVAEGLADLYLDLELPRCGLLEFDAGDRIVEAGYEAARPRVHEWASTLRGTGTVGEPIA